MNGHVKTAPVPGQGKVRKIVLFATENALIIALGGSAAGYVMALPFYELLQLLPKS